MKDKVKGAVVRSSLLASASASRFSLSPRKKPSLPPKPSSTPKTLAFPNLSSCHACGIRTNGKLQILPSQWRIVLLCPKCLFSIESSDICSYCFSKVSISPAVGIDCQACNCRVHRSCLSFVPPSNSFTCVDCWLPKSRAKPTVPDRATRTVVKKARWCLRDAVEQGVAAAAKARERAERKAAEARWAVERARSALSTALHATRDDGGTNEASVLDDKELAVRLHRLMNSSPRISRVLGFADSASMPALPKQKLKGSDFNKDSVSVKLLVCTNDKLFENPDVTSASDRNSSVELGAAGEITSLGDGRMENDAEIGGLESFRRGLEVGAVEKLEGEDKKLEMPMREEQGSCSNKVINSSEDDNSSESRTLCLAGDDGISSIMPKRGHAEPHRYLITYSRRRARAHK